MLRSCILTLVPLLILTPAGSNAARSGAVATAPTVLHLVEGVISPGARADGGPVASKTFYANEEIGFYAKVNWDPSQGSGGNHRIQYKWYSDDVVVMSFGASKTFDVNPTYWWASVHAAHFAPGHHKVELYLDDQLFASDEFDVKLGIRVYEPPEDTIVKETGRALLLKGDRHGFDELANRYRESRERTDSGTWKLSLLYRAVDRGTLPPTDPRWESLQEMADAWLAQQPQSVTAVILDAQLLNAHAGTLRGEGPVEEVAATSLAAYRQLIGRAGGVLDQHAAVAGQDPEWDALRISIARQKGANSQTILTLAGQALAREAYYYPIHNVAVNALMPRWDGSREAVQEYVQMALDHSRLREGTQAYARIYYYVARTTAYSAVDELNQMGAKWPSMKQSLEELRRAYPSTFNQDLARAITCLGGDAVAYRALGRASTDDIVSVAWWDTPDGRRACNEWAFEGKHFRGSPLYRLEGYISFLRGFGPAFWKRVRLAGLIAIILIEVGLALLARLRRARQLSFGPLGTTPTFNPLEYPRSYLLSPVSNPLLTRLAVWMILLGGTVIYALTTIPWPDPLETELVIAASLAVAVAGLMIVGRLASRLVLTGDALILRRLLGTDTLQRHDILGVRQYSLGSGSRTVDVIPRPPGMKSLRVPTVWREDDEFRRWFESLPALVAPETVPETR